MRFIEPVLRAWSHGGALMLPLAMVCGCIFAWIFRASFSLRPLLASADRLSRQLEDCGGNANQVETCLIQESSWLAKAFRICIRSVERKDLSLMEQLEGIETGCLQSQSRDLVILGAFTAAAPLLGLLGTVLGMITTFTATASVDGDLGKQIASGISSALLTTQFGLVIALPGVVGMAQLQKRVRDLETLLTQCRFLIAGAFSERASAQSSSQGSPIP